MSPINLTKLLKKYKSGWVAVSSDYSHVVAHAKKFIELQKIVKDRKDVVVIQAFENYYNYLS
ncbi:hypothetical protein A2W14_00210 [Candidatus Gottesmanbacteria bacterium RBG_16_37_8]|uniref:Uncharacterized protein n=1 Tax=Candidatus Gottesmanbacteria bacterium RBG_16_37_8 TaxID=1798371 RepID=A0A1F5YS23_9BACT|nr:MAG: hypothetical protein A2W14_00210 [Candidatus Gottesmanbacteria bacterium RBG_16_37_8]